MYLFHYVKMIKWPWNSDITHFYNPSLCTIYLKFKFKSCTLCFSIYTGNNDGIVASGPANSWSTISDCTWPNSQVTRNMMTGATAKSYLFSDSSINDVFAKNCFKEISCFDDCSFESKWKFSFNYKMTFLFTQHLYMYAMKSVQ